MFEVVPSTDTHISIRGESLVECLIRFSRGGLAAGRDKPLIPIGFSFVIDTQIRNPKATTIGSCVTPLHNHWLLRFSLVSPSTCHLFFVDRSSFWTGTTLVLAKRHSFTLKNHRMTFSGQHSSTCTPAQASYDLPTNFPGRS